MVESAICRARLLLAGFLVLSFSGLAGCSSSSAKLGTVQGKVKIDGTLANSGFVVFAAENGVTISAPIDPDGTYRALGVPVGTAKVSLTAPTAPSSGGTSPEMKVKMEGMPGGPTVAEPVPIPPKYGKAESSGLTFPVKGGSNTYDIDLTAK